VFVVNSDVGLGEMDAMGWARGIPKLLTDAKIEDVTLKTAYCCTPDKKVICEFRANDKQALSSALNKIKLPFSEISEVTEIV
jgi:hypothetical protein